MVLPLVFISLIEIQNYFDWNQSCRVCWVGRLSSVVSALNVGWRGETGHNSKKLHNPDFVKFSQILKKIVKFGRNFDIFLQNPVSGPHKRHDGR